MTIALDKVTFNRLVRLNLVLLAVILTVALYEALAPSWADFNAGFDMLLAQRFGEVDDTGDTWVITMGAILLALLGWNTVSLIGLLRFKRWARTGLVISTMVLQLLVLPFPGITTSVTTPWMAALVFLNSATIGAILLLAYAAGYGREWFAAATAD